jgi:hypothetical protein
MRTDNIESAREYAMIENEMRDAQARNGYVDYASFPVSGLLHYFQPYLDAYESIGYSVSLTTDSYFVVDILNRLGLANEIGEYGSLFVGDVSTGEFTLVLGCTSNHGRLDSHVYNLLYAVHES